MRPLGDELLVRRAARAVAVQAAGLVFAAILLLVALVTLVVVKGQATARDDLIRSTLQTADDVGDPPAGAWLALVSGVQVRTSPGLPAGALAPLTSLRVRALPGVTLVDLPADGRSYRAGTLKRGDARVVQVLLDLQSEHDQRRRLLQAMGLAAAVGLVVAGALGRVVGRRAVRPLSQALTLQRAFVADASHELRTPLTLLSTRAQLLDRAVQRADVPPQVHLDSTGVVNDVLRLGEVLEDLLVAADPGDRESYVSVDLNALAREAVDTAQAHASSAQVELVVDLHGTDPLLLEGSGPALRRAILSLIDNAIDHTPAQGRVTVSTRRDGRSLLLTVTDTGPGVPPEQAKDVLRRFHSGGHRSGRTHYGLGLALTNDVANRHGGELRLLRSEQGAAFALVLPAA